MQRLALLFAVLALATAAAVEDITLLNPAIDVPPPTKQEVFIVQEMREMQPWSKVKESDLDMYDDDQAQQGDSDASAIDEATAAASAVLHADNADDGEDEVPEDDHSVTVVPQADLLDVSFDDLVPKINDPEFTKMRASLDSMRRQLQPMHKEMCATDPVHCQARRHLNAQILRDVVASQCYRRSCSLPSLVARRMHATKHFLRKTTPRVMVRTRCTRATHYRQQHCRKVRHCCHGSRCNICTKGAEELRHERNRYLTMHRIYTRLYIRYALSLAHYYQAKFHTLSKVFLRTVHRIQLHIDKVKAKNRKLEDQIAQLRADDDEYTRRKAREHDEREKKMIALARVHSAHVAKTAKTIADAKAHIAGEKAKQEELRKAIAATKAKLADVIAEREKHKAETEKMAAEAKNLADNKTELEKKLADLNEQLAAANKRIADLEALINGLKNQIALLKTTIGLARASGTRARNARDEIQTKYNNLLREYQNAIASHNSATASMRNTINDLREQLKELTERCAADACGVCGGDESSCANTSARSTCYAVGDPHYRTFDGMTMDFQYDGQFLVAKHGQNWEIQNLQRLASAPWQPRLNKGIAMRCGKEVVILYEEWGFNRALINGQSTNLPFNTWVRVGPGCSVYARDNDYAQYRYELRGQVAVVTMTRNVWNYGNYISLYIDAPWQWSSGRSMWGLCGDFDAWIGNDRIWIDRNWHTRFIMTNSANDLFRFPHRRAEALIQEGNVGEHTKEKKLDELNGVVPFTNYIEQSAQVQEQMHQQLAQAVFTGVGDDDNTAADAPHTHIDMHGVSKAVIDKAEKHCGRVQRDRNSQVLKQCVFDVINGLRGAAWVFGMANAEGHEREIKRCMHISANSFALIGKAALPHEERHTGGFTIAFWYQPDDTPEDAVTILERGTTALSVAQKDAGIVLSLGDNSCTCADKLAKDTWANVVIAIHHKQGGKVFIDREECCHVDLDLHGETFDSLYRKDIVIGGSGEDVAEANVAHVTFAPSVITSKLIKVHGNVAPEDCKPEEESP